MFRPQEGDPTFAFLPISFKRVLEKGGFSKVRYGPNAKPEIYVGTVGNEKEREGDKPIGKPCVVRDRDNHELIRTGSSVVKVACAPIRIATMNPTCLSFL